MKLSEKPRLKRTRFLINMTIILIIASFIISFFITILANSESFSQNPIRSILVSAIIAIPGSLFFGIVGLLLGAVIGRIIYRDQPVETGEIILNKENVVERNFAIMGMKLGLLFGFFVWVADMQFFLSPGGPPANISRFINVDLMGASYNNSLFGPLLILLIAFGLIGFIIGYIFESMKSHDA